ncbi:MAG: S8 family peptidase [Acidobacteriota bacterium]|nr:S8 family peptidase [Acidobacteriota bacterium]
MIEYFLLGRTRQGALEFFVQDGGVVTDVWLGFARNPDDSLRVLVAPVRGANTTAVGYALHHAITAYRRAFPSKRKQGTPNVSPLDNFVAVNIYFDELVRVVLPITKWWHRKNLISLRGNPSLQKELSATILRILGVPEKEPGTGAPPKVDNEHRRVLEAAPLAALIGVFHIAQEKPAEVEQLRELNLDPYRKPDDREKLIEWINAHADDIASEWIEELSAGESAWPVVSKAIPADLHPQARVDRGENAELIDRVFLDREASLASESNCTIKADAAKRVFDVSCRGTTWAIIDSGISTTHPAFIDHYARNKREKPQPNDPRRIKATLDFTEIQRIRNFDLLGTGDAEERETVIGEVIKVLEALPGRRKNGAFRKMARENLNAIAEQLAQRFPPDWNLIEPLIRIEDEGDGSDLPSDHGTHVAGILGGDWRNAKGEVQLQGVCPDIDLYDLRAVHGKSIESTEFALLAALEYVQFVNARAGSNGPIIHGVNISMSIPHKVRSYGCGATPVCVACDRLVGAGVIVVAAAGNRGWNEMEIGFGNFVSSSITDPGNARNVITVGSTHGSKPHVYGVSYFSSRGPTGDGRIKPDIVAPGERILGPMRGDADGELDGTSMAAPFVSGAAAMLISRHRELIGDPDRVKQILLDSATDLGREKYFQGHGLVDVLRAMQSI